EWIRALPAIDPNSPKNTKLNRRVLFYDPRADRAEQYKSILAGYDIELALVNDFHTAADLYYQSPDQYSCALIYEIIDESTASTFCKHHKERLGVSYPPIIIGTPSTALKSNSEIRYLRKPFGLGVLIETLEACFIKGAE